MKNFHINPEGWIEPEPAPHWYDIGTRIIFPRYFESTTVLNITI